MIRNLLIFTFSVLLLFMTSCALNDTAQLNEAPSETETLSLDTIESTESSRFTSFICDDDDDNGHTSRPYRIRRANVFLNLLERGRLHRYSPYLFSDDVVFVISGPEGLVPLAGTYTGIDEVSSYLVNYFSLIDIDDVEYQFSLIQGNQINIHVRIEGEVEETDNEFDLEFVYALTLNDEYKIERLELYYDTYNFTQAFSEDGPEFVTDLKTGNNEFDPTATGTKEVAQVIYDSFVVGDIPTMLSVFAPESHFIIKGGVGVTPLANIFDGSGGIVQFLTSLGISSTYTNFYVDHSVGQGNRIDYFAYESWIGNETGKVFSSTILHSILVKDGKVVEFKSYNDSYSLIEALTP